MAFVLRQSRTFVTPVVVHSHDAAGKSIKGEISATFKVVKTTDMTDSANAEERLLDMVLVSVDGLKVFDEKGKELKSDDDLVLEAAKADPEVSLALVSAYNSKITEKNLRKT